MKRIIISLGLIIICLLTSCSTTNNKQINIVYNNYVSEEINYEKGISSSFCVASKEEIFSGTIIEYSKGIYYALSTSNLGKINDSVSIVLDDTKSIDGKITGIDTKNGMSLIEFSGSETLFTIPTQTTERKKGDCVYTVSTPLSSTDSHFCNSVTKGCLSRMSSIYISTDASVNSSSFGGGLYNKDGYLLGIIVSKIYSDVEEGSFVQGSSTVLKIEYAMKSFEQMKKAGEPKRTQLGITVTEYHKAANDVLAQIYPTDYYSKIKVPDFDRVYCVVIDIDKLKNNVGTLIKQGDIILECNSVEIIHNEDLSSVLNFLQKGDTLTFKIMRYDEESNSFEQHSVPIILLK